jgi:predicted DNA-binding transcriptional regulator AlpA
VQRFSFTFVVDGLSMDDVEQVNIPTEGCEGLTLAEIGGVTLAVFEREAESPDRALTGALDEIEAAHPAIRVRRLDQDLVSVADIAERSGRSRQSVRQLADGDRGPGDFPDPVGTVGKAIRVWEWASVDEWLRLHEYGGDVECLIDADTAAVFDGMLAGRRRSTPEAGSPPLALRK